MHLTRTGDVWLFRKRSGADRAIRLVTNIPITYERMGLLDSRRPPHWYDPGKLWSGDRLALAGASLGPEIRVTDMPVHQAASIAIERAEQRGPGTRSSRRAGPWLR